MPPKDSIAGAVAADTMAVSMIKGHIVVQGGGASLKTGSQVQRAPNVPLP